MKFLIALSVLASASVFANDMDHEKWVKCYDTSQSENQEVVYKLVKKHHDIRLVFPFEQDLKHDNGCLESKWDPSIDGNKIRFCPGEGQRVNGLVPVDVTHGQEEDTVYCDKKIWRWFRHHPETL